jgi:hypothetical protein
MPTFWHGTSICDCTLLVYCLTHTLEQNPTTTFAEVRELCACYEDVLPCTEELVSGPYPFTISHFPYFRLEDMQFHGWLRHCATSQKVAVSRPDWVIGFISICQILPSALGPGNLLGL